MPVGLPAGAHGEPRRAEYAVRWDPSQGGPATGAEVVALLGGSGAVAESFEVRYYDLPRPAGAPADATVILRQRAAAGGEAEFRLKYRRAHLLGSRWACPAGISFRRSEEVDVGFGGAEAPTRVYSYSCTVSRSEPPGQLHAVARHCLSRVARYQAGAGDESHKVEEWTLAGGGVRLEVSRTAANSVDELARFTDLVARLRARGAKPLDESKTELGSRCP